MAILGKTEGNGNVNDFTRGYATLTLTLMLEKHLGARARDVCLVMSGGTEGAMAPHWTVFERAEGAGHGPCARDRPGAHAGAAGPNSSAASRRSTRWRTA